MKKAIILTLALLSAVFLNGKGFGSISFQHLTEKDGFESNDILDIAIGDDGIIWFATGIGLAEYDGIRVKQHFEDDQRTQNFSDRVAIGRDGTIYVLHPSGISAYNPRNSEFRSIHSGSTSAIFCSDYVYASDGYSILRMENGGSSMNSFIEIPTESGRISALLGAKDGKIYVGTEYGTVMICQDGSITGTLLSCGSEINRMFIDSKGNLWVCSTSGGLFRISPDGSTFNYTHSPKNTVSLSSNFVREVNEDNLGNLWIGTFTGLDCLSPDGTITRYKAELGQADALSNSSVWSIKKDAQGTLWIGTYFGCVNYFNPEYQIYSHIKESTIEGNGLSSNIMTFIKEERNGLVWLATEGGGLNLLDKRSGAISWYTKESDYPRHLAGNNVKAICYDEDRMWVGTHMDGISVLNRRSLTPEDVRTMAGKDIMALTTYGRDSIAVVSHYSLYIMDKSGRKVRKISDWSPYGHHPTSIVMLGDELLLGYSWAGLVRTNIISGLRKKYSAEDGLPAKRISQLMIDTNGALWVATFDSGLYQYVEGKDSFVSIASSEIPDEINSIDESKTSGSIVTAFNGGIGLINPKTLTCEIYGRKEGFPQGYGRHNSLCCTSSGEIYLGGENGVLTFLEKDLRLYGKPFRMFFRNIPSSPVKVPSRPKTITLEYASTNHIPIPEGPAEYRIDKGEWKKADGPYWLTLPVLRQGKHTLELRSSGISSALCTPAQIELDVDAPWYLEKISIAAFIFAGLMILAATALLIIRARRRRMAEYLATLEAQKSIEAKFLVSVKDRIREKLSDSEFDVSDLAREMAVSRTSLYERLMKAGGQSPSAMISEMRLERAARILIEMPDRNITEVSEMSGYSSPKYFSKVFKERYGKSPLTYRKSKIKTK